MSKIDFNGPTAKKYYMEILKHEKELQEMPAIKFAEKYNINYKVLLHFLKTFDIPYFSRTNTLEVVKLLKQGNLSYQEIANLRGITRQRVSTIAKEHNIKSSTAITKKQKYSEILKKSPEVRNMNAREISEKFDISYSMTLDILKSENIPFGKWQYQVLSNRRYQNLLKDLASGNFTYKRLSGKYKVSITWIVKVAKEHHLTYKELREVKYHG